jgi:amino acid permease
MSNNLKNTNESVLTPDQVISTWTKICEGLYHFNNLSNGCRLLASTWLLASVAALGYVSTKEMPIQPEVLVPVLGGLSSLGVLLLWIMDQLVYIRFIEAYFSEALEIERKYEFLPKVNDNMPVLFGKKGLISYVRVYYLGCMGAPMLIALLSFVPQSIILHELFIYMVYAIALAIILAVGSYLFFQKPEYQKVLEEKRRKSKQTNIPDRTIEKEDRQ